jgi:hypothetical protein
MKIVPGMFGSGVRAQGQGLPASDTTSRAALPESGATIATPALSFEALINAPGRQTAQVVPARSFQALGMFGRFGASKGGNAQSFAPAQPDGTADDPIVRDQPEPIYPQPIKGGRIGAPQPPETGEAMPAPWDALPEAASMPPTASSLPLVQTSEPISADPPSDQQSAAGLSRLRGPLPVRSAEQARAPGDADTVRLTLAETEGSLQIVARGGGLSAEMRAELRRRADQLAAETGLSIGDLHLDGSPEPMSLLPQGALHGRRAR